MKFWKQPLLNTTNARVSRNHENHRNPENHKQRHWYIYIYIYVYTSSRQPPFGTPMAPMQRRCWLGLWEPPRGWRADYTKPSHSQSLALCRSQTSICKEFPQRERTLCQSFRRNTRCPLRIQLQSPRFIRKIFVSDLVVTISYRIFGAGQNSHSHSQPYRCDRGAFRRGPVDPDLSGHHSLLSVYRRMLHWFPLHARVFFSNRKAHFVHSQFHIFTWTSRANASRILSIHAVTMGLLMIT